MHINENQQTTKATDEEAEQPKKKCDAKYWTIRIIICVVVLGVLTLAIVNRDKVREITESFLEWLRENPVIGPVVLSCVYVVVVIFLVPGSLLTIGGAVALQ